MHLELAVATPPCFPRAKNYALQRYDASSCAGGVPIERAERYGERLERAITALFAGDVAGVRAAYVDTVRALRSRQVATREVTSRVRLTKTPTEYLTTREQRRELSYEALLGSGRSEWEAGERIRVYRANGGRAALFEGDEEDEAGGDDPSDYDAEYYVKQLGETYAARLSRALDPEDFAAVFAPPEQLLLFPRRLDLVRPVLRKLDG